MSADIHEYIFVDGLNVRFVDAVPSGGSGQFNFLFRGPNPLTPTQPYQFNYDLLTASMENAAQAAGFNLQQPYHLIDINLLQWENANEVPMIEAEYQFFQDRPDLGEFQFWETNGTGLCPVEPPLSDPEVQNYLATNLAIWLTDRLADLPPDQQPPGRMQQLRAWLEAENDRPNVIYAHCEGGIDRTGELMGAYYLRWLGKTWAEMNCLNYRITEPKPRPFGCNNYRAVLWYAIYLNKVLGFDLNYNEAFPCSDWPEPHFGCGSASSNPNPDNPWVACEGP